MMQPATVASTPDHCATLVGDVSVAPARSMPEDPLAARNRATWTAGDFDRIAVGFASGAAAFVQRVGVSLGDNVLDVACGTGNLAIPAARRGGIVTGLDIAPNLLVTARARSAAMKLEIQFDEGNAEALPYATGTFRTVMSMFGVMFAPRPERALAELVRVTRPGGRIALASWMPQGFVGQMLRAHASRVPPPEGVPSPLLWGDETVIRKRLSAHNDRICAVTFTPRTIEMKYPVPPAQVAELFRDYYGPSVRTFAALEERGRADFLAELTALWESRNVAPAGRTLVEAEYLEVMVQTR